MNTAVIALLDLYLKWDTKIVENKSVSKIYVSSSNKLTRVWILISGKTKPKAKSVKWRHILIVQYMCIYAGERDKETKRKRDTWVKLTNSVADSAPFYMNEHILEISLR